MSNVKGLRCRECGREYPQEPMQVCDYCFGPLEVVYNYEAIRAAVDHAGVADGPPSIWRYREFLPLDDDPVVDLDVGFTPLLRAGRLAAALGLDHLYLKNDCVNPTQSVKDRVVAVAVAKALEFGFDTVACASTGNLAASVAAHAAKGGLRSFVFVPASIDPAKLVGIVVYDPLLVAVDGSYDMVNRLCSELSDRYGWAFLNINLRPYYAEGGKTLAFEMAEQLGWRAPDNAVVPIATGSLFTRVWRGLRELSGVGLIPPVRTRMFGAQASGAAPVASAYEAGSLSLRAVQPDTIARSLAIGNPAEGYYALKVIKESRGAACAVTDEEIMEGVALLARTEGIFAETAGGVTIAALRHLVAAGAIKRDEVTVACITGAGSRTPEALLDRLREPLRIAPTVASFEAALAAHATAGLLPKPAPADVRLSGLGPAGGKEEHGT